MEDLEISGSRTRARSFMDSARSGTFLFSLVISYTDTCRVPGITVAGARPEMIQYTPPADAEYLHYGYCKSIDSVPTTPDGKPTPGLLTKVALESSSIPHLTINAGSRVAPRLPFIETGLPPGGNIAEGPAMTDRDVSHAVDYGRIVGRSLASLAGCLVIGECVPGGTTTALAVLRGLGADARVSSSIPENPVDLKDRVASAALSRLGPDHPYSVVARVGDPMIPFVAGMLSAASTVSRVLLAGGTQMAAVLALASRIGFDEENTAVGTTSYVAGDKSANFGDLVRGVADVPAMSVDPGMAGSGLPGLRAFSEGFAKEGVGAGGCIISAMLKSGLTRTRLLRLAEDEYRRLAKSGGRPAG